MAVCRSVPVVKYKTTAIAAATVVTPSAFALSSPSHSSASFPSLSRSSLSLGSLSLSSIYVSRPQNTGLVKGFVTSSSSVAEMDQKPEIKNVAILPDLL
ncbi:hypothetical protein OROGR_005623 [Orobanche gracilis]